MEEVNAEGMEGRYESDDQDAVTHGFRFYGLESTLEQPSIEGGVKPLRQ